MGTDIHMAVEKRQPYGWTRVLPTERLLDDFFYEKRGNDPDSYVFKTWYNNRNYALFAALADVRNGYGFAGVPTFVPIQPVAPPRGLPGDLSPEVQRLIDDDFDEDDISLGDHSFSWLLVSELLAYDWDQIQTVVGVVPIEAFQQRLEKFGKEFPAPAPPYESWSGGISGPNIHTIDAKALIRGSTAINPPGARVHVSDAWRVPLRDRCKVFVDKVIPALQRVGDPTQVRIVFGFDS